MDVGGTTLILRECGRQCRYAVSSDAIPGDPCSCISFLTPAVLIFPGQTL